MIYSAGQEKWFQVKDVIDKDKLGDCKNQNVKRHGFAVGKIDASSSNGDWECRFVWPKIHTRQWTKSPILSLVNAYHGECHHLYSTEGSKECGITKTVLNTCLTNKDVTKDDGVNPDTFKINRVENNWNEKEGYVVWQDKYFSRRARKACETIIYMPCKPGKNMAGKLVIVQTDKVQLEHCEVLIEAANSAGYQLMIVESNWKANSRVPKRYDVIDTRVDEILEVIWGESIEPGPAWFFCKCKPGSSAMEDECNGLKQH